MKFEATGMFVIVSFLLYVSSYQGAGGGKTLLAAATETPAEAFVLIELVLALGVELGMLFMLRVPKRKGDNHP